LLLIDWNQDGEVLLVDVELTLLQVTWKLLH
jgi:hypothetical protein